MNKRNIKSFLFLLLVLGLISTLVIFLIKVHKTHDLSKGNMTLINKILSNYTIEEIEFLKQDTEIQELIGLIESADDFQINLFGQTNGEKILDKYKKRID